MAEAKRVPVGFAGGGSGRTLVSMNKRREVGFGSWYMQDDLDKGAYITEAETLALLKYAQEAKADIVEIGTFLGGTTANLARHLPLDPNIALWTIDLFNYYSQGIDPVPIYNNLAEIERAFVLIGNSNHIGRYWGRGIGLLFIDGGHDYTTVSTDFNVWSQWVIPGGIIAMHDAKVIEEIESLRGMKIGGDPGGVVIFANEVKEAGEWKVIEAVDSTLFFVRSNPRGT